MLTYNAFLRPPPVSWGDKNQCRAERIAERLLEEPTPHDIIVLNESFEKEAVDILAQGLEERFPYQALRQPAARGFRTNGGLSILSRHPIEKWSAERFDRCSGEFNDCMASKGFLWALVRVSDHLKVNVVATHMNSGRRSSAREARASQLEEIRDFLDTQPQVQRWPTMLLGDLNINGLRWKPRHEETGELTEYAEAMELLGNSCASCETASCYASCEPGAVDVFRDHHGSWKFGPEGTRAVNTYNCTSQSLAPCKSPNEDANWKHRTRIDYILHFGAPELMEDLEVDVAHAASRPFRDDACGTEFLSDHKGVEATIEIRRDVDMQASRQDPGNDEESSAKR